ncbi:putative 2,3-dihydroxybenzoate-AMP ligase [Gordonia araii NBRC 100433]|uniref:Putative 2,3-dihydroxybenzoate-AMP ligase n=1 Tax=Gordonia araii NBRC 100433 TaxID=1073574 RepID=G7H6U2_9ACTN|nr:AMP-binding protein [Gordonia araii]NNG95985.1 AMP-binding protein [Gordonia araii NBRC 100433]GAB11567.1 putative 2,3-dihydroxybenzoate-AMP ligase [Gordonia araii NBRC 100433]
MTQDVWGDRLVLPPVESRARYRDAGEWSDDPLPRRFHASADRFADRLAVITTRAEYSYGELDRRTDQIAAGLHDLGLRPHDPVIFQVTNRAETVLAWYGCLKAGLIPVATLAAHRMHEIGHVAEAVGARAHLVEAGTKFDLVAFADDVRTARPTMEFVLTIGEDDVAAGRRRIEDLGNDIAPARARRLVEEIEESLDPLDVAVFQLSGGTTGVPKVIPRLHAEYWDNGRLYAQCLGWTEETRVAHLIPLTHNAGVSCALHAAHSVGAALVLADPDPVPAFELMARSRATDALFGHGHFQALLLDEFAPARETLRRSVLSGSKVPPEIFDAVDDDVRWAGQMFGMGEGLFLVSPLDSPRESRLTTVGQPIATTDEYRIVEPGTETDLPDGKVGELVCRGPYTISGYYNAPEHNGRAFTSDGYYRTGDLASVRVIEGRRYVSIEGRMKDLINRGGEKINAEELEKLLLSHPDIAEAAVVAMPDPRLGERTCAYLVATDDRGELTLAQVQEHLDGLGVAKFKWPERLEWVPALPRTNVGKINKVSLRADIADRLTQTGNRP